MADEPEVAVAAADETPEVPRYVLKDDNGRKFQSDDPNEGVVICDLRPE